MIQDSVFFIVIMSRYEKIKIKKRHVTLNRM